MIECEIMTEQSMVIDRLVEANASESEINAATAKSLTLQTCLERVVRKRKIEKEMLEDSSSETVKRKKKLQPLDGTKVPKFQLEAWEANSYKFAPGPRYPSIDHFIDDFETMMRNTRQEVDDIWDTCLDNAMPYDFKPWIKDLFGSCNTWMEAKKILISSFGDEKDAIHYRVQLFNTKMTANQTVNEFTSQFMRTASKAQFQARGIICSVMYRYNLYKPLMTKILERLAEQKKPEDHVWPVQDIAAEARILCGSDPVRDRFKDNTNNMVTKSSRTLNEILSKANKKENYISILTVNAVIFKVT